MSSANRKLVMVRPAMPIVPSCSSSTSDIILPRKMLKSVGDNMHPADTYISHEHMQQDCPKSRALRMVKLSKY